MDHHAELALIKQDFERLLAMCDPVAAVSWRPTESQRLAYVQLAERVLGAIDRIRNLERRNLLREGKTQAYVPQSILSCFREQIAPRVCALKEALDHLDPEGTVVRQLLDELGKAPTNSHRIKQTFETGIDQVRDLIDRNPDWGDDHHFMPDATCEVIDSPLIAFDPDSWLDRARELAPIRTHRKGVSLPIHIRLRVEELNRAYVFGCWLSVLALSRAILEYAILDNLHKFGIEPMWSAAGRETKRKAKKLSHLIEELAPHVPLLTDKLTRLRDFGNDYLHPKQSQMSKESLLQRQPAARDALETVIEVVEELYLAQGTA